MHTSLYSRYQIFFFFFWKMVKKDIKYFLHIIELIAVYLHHWLMLITILKILYSPYNLFTSLIDANYYCQDTIKSFPISVQSTLG